MAIRIIEGVPGSGKTYYAVNHLVENYIKQNKDVLIITNIESLVLDHLNLDDLVSKSSLKEVFSVDYVKKLSSKTPEKGIIFLIDEAQKYFHKKFYDVDVFYFFQYHRHLGIDIYLITQNEKLLPLQLTTLSEYTIHSQPRTSSIVGELKYVVKLTGEPIDRKILKPKQEIYDLYSSMSQKEVEKVRNPFRKYAIACVLILIACGYVFKITFLDKGERAHAAELAKHKAQAPVSIQSPISAPIAEDKFKDHTFAIPVSYIVDRGSLFIVEPLLKKVVPYSAIKRKITVEKVGKSLLITIFYTKDEFDKIEAQEEKFNQDLEKGTKSVKHSQG